MEVAHVYADAICLNGDKISLCNKSTAKNEIKLIFCSALINTMYIKEFGGIN